MEMETGSVTDSITAVLNKDLKRYGRDLNPNKAGLFEGSVSWMGGHLTRLPLLHISTWRFTAHMLQHSSFERTAPVLHFFLKFIVLRLSCLKRQIFMNFSSPSHFLQTRCENLG